MRGKTLLCLLAQTVVQSPALHTITSTGRAARILVATSVHDTSHHATSSDQRLWSALISTHTQLTLSSHPSEPHRLNQGRSRDHIVHTVDFKLYAS